MQFEWADLAEYPDSRQKAIVRDFVVTISCPNERWIWKIESGEILVEFWPQRRLSEREVKRRAQTAFEKLFGKVV